MYFHEIIHLLPKTTSLLTKPLLVEFKFQYIKKLGSAASVSVCFSESGQSLIRKNSSEPHPFLALFFETSPRGCSIGVSNLWDYVDSARDGLDIHIPKTNRPGFAAADSARCLVIPKKNRMAYSKYFWTSFQDFCLLKQFCTNQIHGNYCSLETILDKRKRSQYDFSPICNDEKCQLIFTAIQDFAQFKIF